MTAVTTPTMRSSASLLPPPAEEVVLDDRIRGVPPGTAALRERDLGRLGWRPADGRMALPVLTLDEPAFLSNRDLFLAILRERGAAVAPHAKTPMSPDLAHALIDAGAWGATVADIRQAAVLLKAGVARLLIANEVGGVAGARRLADLLSAWPVAEVVVFADSAAAARALGEAWSERPDLAPLGVLVETGAGRAGARTLQDAQAVVDAVEASNGRLALKGAATYEGAAAQATPEATADVLARLLDFTGAVFRLVRERAGPAVPLLLSAGGSVFFDLVLDSLLPVVRADGNAILLLRSGAIFFHDHGVYHRAMQALDTRGGLSLGGTTMDTATAFRPALRLWAEVLSRPEPGLAVCGMGLRDVSFDQGLPVPLAVTRGGRPLTGGARGLRLTRLNDQHAFLDLEEDALQVGDVIEFGISHPCTCLDRYRVIFGTDAQGVVRHAFPTCFG